MTAVQNPSSARRASADQGYPLLPQQAGDRTPAEARYRQIVQADPHNVDAWLMLGTILQEAGKVHEVIEVASLPFSANLRCHRQANPIMF